MNDFHPVALGSVGTACTFSIEVVNPWLGFICGVLTAIYLCQQIAKNRSEKK